MGTGAWLAMRLKPSSSAPASLCRRSQRCGAPLEMRQDSTTSHYALAIHRLLLMSASLCHIIASTWVMSISLNQ